MSDLIEISEEPTIPDIVDEHWWEMLGEEPVSEEVEKAAKYYIPDESYHMIIESKEEGSGENVYDYVQMINMFKAGANWKEQQMMSKAIDAQCFGFQGAALFSFRLPSDKYLVGSNVKVIVIKEETK